MSLLQPLGNPALDAAPGLGAVFFVFLKRLHLLGVPLFAPAVGHPLRSATGSLADPSVVVEMPDAFRNRLKPRIVNLRRNRSLSDIALESLKLMCLSPNP